MESGLSLPTLSRQWTISGHSLDREFAQGPSGTRGLDSGSVEKSVEKNAVRPVLQPTGAGLDIVATSFAC
jgi:hypothetical protein